jgi:hypothetical protein
VNTSDHEPIDNDHQKSVQGKKQHGPEDKIDKSAGGNEGSKGQNSEQRARGTNKESGDEGDERKYGGSGGGQDNRQNRDVNRS